MTAQPQPSPYTRTELVWAGKRTQVDRVALPFQRVETVNAPRGADLFSSLGGADGWRNKLIWGDNKLVMASLLQGDPSAGIEPLAGKVDLIYIDPPFDTGADFSFRTQVGEAEIEKEPSILEQLAYRDTWGKGEASWLSMLAGRLALIRDLLSDTGNFYLHLDYRLYHYAKVLCDEIFGVDALRNEVIWYYNSGARDQFGFGKRHHTILRYSKSEAHIPFFNDRGRGSVESVRVPYSPDINIPASKAHYYDAEGKVRDDVWQIPIIAQNDKAERCGYETQKPERLLDLVVASSSPPKGLVADFFLGSGTTAAVAHKLGRRWIGCDLGRFAIHTSRKRLLDLGATFEVFNLGKYERSHWQGATLGDQLRAYVDFILALYHAEPVPGFRHLHGKKAARAVHVGAVDAPVTFAELADVLAECRETHTQAVDVLGWEWEMGVNQQAPQQAESYGVDLRLYQIPNDVMGRRAKAEDVRFYSLAYVEIEIHTVQARTIQVELKDFVIPDMDLIPQAVRDKVSRWSDFIDYWAVDFEYDGETFRNAWQSFRTRARRTLDTVSITHTYDRPGTYAVLVKVVDVFGIDSTKRLEVTV